MIMHLARKLNAAGLGIDAATRSVVTSVILHRGEKEFNRLRFEVSELEYYEASAIRTLGTGMSLARFAASGVPMTPRYSAPVEALAGLANLIVSAFDAMLDRGGAVPELFPVSVSLTHNESREATVVRKLVRLYFRRLELLPQVHESVRALIYRAIRRMYEAELASASPRIFTRSTWWRKNVLPIVVMGFPAWLAVAQFDQAEAKRHLRWLCRMGEFFGWIDDCADLTSDGRTGQPNRMSECLAQMTEEDLTNRIARQGCAVLNGWTSEADRQTSRDIFPVLVWTWLESGSTGNVLSPTTL